MNQEIADPNDVAACLEKVRATLGQLDELQDSLKQRAATLAASAEDITGRLRSVGIDTPEAIEKSALRWTKKPRRRHGQWRASYPRFRPAVWLPRQGRSGAWCSALAGLGTLQRPKAYRCSYCRMARASCSAMPSRRSPNPVGQSAPGRCKQAVASGPSSASRRNSACTAPLFG